MKLLLVLAVLVYFFDDPSEAHVSASGLLVITAFWLVELVQMDLLFPRAICEL